MRKLIYILVVAAVAATTYAIKRPENQAKAMTDSQLMAAIDSCIERDLPQSAEPFFAEMKSRARNAHDYKLTLSLIDKEMTLNAPRMESRDEIRKALDREIALSETPLREVLLLRKLHLEYGGDVLAAEIAGKQTELSQHKASEIIDESDLLIDMSAYDYMMLTLARNGVNIDEYISGWKEKGTATSKILATMIELEGEHSIPEEHYYDEHISITNDETRKAFSKEKTEEIDKLAFSAETKALANMLWGKYYIDMAIDADADNTKSDQQTATVSDSLSDMAMTHLNTAKDLVGVKSDIKSRKNVLYENIMASISRIDGQKVTIVTERTNMPNKYVPVMITTKNIDALSLDIYRYKSIFNIKNETALRHVDIDIPKVKGRVSEQNTYTELEGLPAGQYIIVAQHGNLMNYHETLVTDIAAETINSNSERLMAVVSATDGTPMKGATVDGKRVDALGMTAMQSNRYSDVTIANGADDKISLRLYGWSKSDEQEKTNKNFQMVTDRGIYRPGQTVKFKLWKYLYNTQKKWSADAGEKIHITLRSHNWREIAKTTVTLNDMGAAWGELNIPDDVDLGHATLMIGNYQHSHSIRIDEYKRTGNNILFDPISKEYCLGDTVLLSGRLISADAKPVVNAQVVINDTIKTTTDAEGHFEHSFTAMQSYNHFEVKATDMAGETTESGHTIEADKKGVRFSLSLKGSSYVYKGSDASMYLETRNCDSQPLEREVKVEIDRMTYESEMKPAMMYGWHKDAVDAKLGYAHTDINNENNKLTSTETIISFTDTIRGRKTLPIDMSKMSCGIYRIKATTTSLKGEEMTDESYLNVIEPNIGSDIYDAIVVNCGNKNNEFEAGKTVDIDVSSRLDNACVLLCAEFAGKVISKQYVDISKGTRRITIDVPQDKKGYRAMHITATTDNSNRHYEHTLTLNRAKDSNDNIDMTISTLRDHTTPGADETCTIAVKAEKDTSDIELVASMYDTRLDRFTSNNWLVFFHKNEPWSHMNINRVQPNIKTFSSKTSFKAESGYGSHSNYNDIVACLGETTIPAYEWGRYMIEEKAMLYGMTANKRMMKSMAAGAAPMTMDCVAVDENAAEVVAEEEADFVFKQEDAKPEPSPDVAEAEDNNDMMRTDFRETVFFYPDLKPDDNGNVTFSFTTPDNLTTYKLRAVAHNKNMSEGYIEKNVVVSKPLTVKAWLPRVVTEGDTIDISMDITTDLPADSITTNLKVNGNEASVIAHPTATTWRIVVPSGADEMQIDFSATSGKYSDGERHVIPVRQLYQEISEGQTFMLMEPGSYDIANPFADTKAASVKHTTFNYNASAWIEILRALPYLNDSPYPTSDTYIGQIESSAIAMLFKKRDDVREVVAMGDNAFAEKHQMEANSPWVLFNQYQQQHDKQVRMMLSGSKAENTKIKALRKLKKMQMSNGAFPWMEGMDESEYMTRHILATLGTLVRFNLIDASEVNDICVKGKRYIIDCIRRDVDEWEEHKVKDPIADATMLYDLYTLTCIGGNKEMATDAKLQKAIAAIPKASKLKGTSAKLIAAIVLNRIGRKTDAQMMVQSACENLVRPDEHTAHISKLSRAWFDDTTLTHAMLIIAMNEIEVEEKAGDQKRVANWLVKEKRSTHWGNTQSTSRAVLALLTQCTDNRATDTVEWSEDRKANVSTYYSTPFTSDDKSVKIEKHGKMASWGSWQQTALLPTDQMTAMSSEEISIKRTIDGGNKVGDKVTITLTITTGIDMDFVRLSDYRPAAFEPVDQTSGYRGWWWLRSIGDKISNNVPHYYSPRDESVDIFISHLQRGVHTFSYECYITNSGDMNGGYAEAICTYTEGMEAHTEGQRVSVEGR
ncbi:MAG: MG2 domain-containing protein [Bacteroidales bacterium]|nr:MG2 domain-containing protein [Bacteroidales bacterium]